MLSVISFILACFAGVFKAKSAKSLSYFYPLIYPDLKVPRKQEPGLVQYWIYYELGTLSHEHWAGSIVTTLAFIPAELWNDGHRIGGTAPTEPHQKIHVGEFL